MQSKYNLETDRYHVHNPGCCGSEFQGAALDHMHDER